MNPVKFFQRIQAAHNLSLAMSEGKTPRSSDLEILGLPEKFKNRFER